MARKTVLLVEDDVGIREALVALLHDEPDFVPVEVPNGAAALRVLEQLHPQLVLLDLAMPEVDGFELAERLRANPRTARVPVVAMTALAPTEDAEVRARAAGCDAVIQKPFDVDDLLSTLRRLAGSSDAAAAPA